GESEQLLIGPAELRLGHAREFHSAEATGARSVHEEAHQPAHLVGGVEGDLDVHPGYSDLLQPGKLFEVLVAGGDRDARLWPSLPDPLRLDAPRRRHLLDTAVEVGPVL